MKRLGLLLFLLAVPAALRADRIPLDPGFGIDIRSAAARLQAGSCRAFLTSPTHAVPQLAGSGAVGGLLCDDAGQQHFYLYDGTRQAYWSQAIVSSTDADGIARATSALTEAIQLHIAKTEAEWPDLLARSDLGARPCAILSPADLDTTSGPFTPGRALALICTGPANLYVYVATDDGYARQAILPLGTPSADLRARASALVREQARKRGEILTVPAHPAPRVAAEAPAPEPVADAHLSAHSRLLWLLIAFAIICAIVVLVVFRWLFESWERDKKRRAADEVLRRMEEIRRLEAEREWHRQQPARDAAEQLRQSNQALQDEIDRIKRLLGGNP